MKKKNSAFAILISYIFHPLFMPTLGLLFFYFSKKINSFNLYASDSVQENNLVILSTTIVFSLVVPGLLVFVLKRTNQIETYHMHKKEERLLPFALMAMSIMCAYYLLFDYFNIETDPIIKVFYFGCFLSIVGALIITLEWKISIHMIGIGGFTGAVFLLSYISNEVLLPALVIAILITGLVGYSRLSLKAHSLKQIIAGFTLGFLSETIFLLLV
jgi:membrane-associated phospholipid phosphatase